MMTATAFDPDFAAPSEWARMYRSAGLQVVPARFPMRDRTDKRPALADWVQFQNELASEAVFEGWFGTRAEPNMGVITGRASGRVLVIDIDDYRSGAGAEWWASVTGGIEPETWQQETGGGGRQFFFRVPEGVEISSHRTPIADIRCQGGFAMLPPSRHMSGKEYRWARERAPWDVDLDEAKPELVRAVVELIESHRNAQGGSGATERTPPPPADYDAFGNIIDGRESFMRDVVWASVLNLHRRLDGVPPCEVVAREAFEEAFGTYLRRVRTRLPGVDNESGLEREGRGRSLFMAKWQAEMRKWHGKVAEAAALPKVAPVPFEVAAQPNAAGATGPLILSAAQFVAGFVPPEYLIDGMVQQGYLYSLTARTGHGKTAVGLYLAQCVARGQHVKDRAVKQGSVLFLAGENPDDIRARYLVLADAHGFDADQAPIHFIAGVIDIAACLQRIHAEAASLPDLSLVIVDTAAAYFKGDDGNSNVQQGEYARLLRQLTFLPGKPAVIVPSHPVKNAHKENLLPVGGGAFLNEVDGNLTLWSGADKQTSLHWQGKFRGPEFEPLTFKLETKTSDRVVNAAGELMPSVVASPITDFELEAGEARQETEENRLLFAINDAPRSSIAALALRANFVDETGQPQKSKVFRLCKRLLDDKLVELHRGKYRLSARGRKEIGQGDDDD